MLMYCNDFKIYGTKIYRTDETGETSIIVNNYIFKKVKIKTCINLTKTVNNTKK